MPPIGADSDPKLAAMASFTLTVPHLMRDASARARAWSRLQTAAFSP